jgi:hypothetical protein
MAAGFVSGTACTARGSTCCTGSALRLSLGGTGPAGGTGGGDGAGWSAAGGCAAASGAAEDGADGAGSAGGSGVTAACGIAAGSTGGTDSWCRSRMGVPTIPAATTGPKAMIHFCMCATVAPARGRGQCSARSTNERGRHAGDETVDRCGIDPAQHRDDAGGRIDPGGIAPRPAREDAIGRGARIAPAIGVEPP